MLITEHNQDLSMDISAMFLPELSLNDGPFNFDMDLHPEDDFLQQLSNGLEIPMLLDDSSQHVLNSASDDLLQGDELHSDLLSTYPCLEELGDVDPMQWGPEAFPNLEPLPDVPDLQIKEEIKIEPGSPLSLQPPSPSPSSTSSSDTWLGGEPFSEVKFVLETPPISPPQSSDGSPPDSPDLGTSCKDSALMVSPVEIVPVVKNGFRVGGGTKIMITQQPANATKNMKIQPKPEPGMNPTLPVVTVPKVNKDSKTIVLSAQHFAALTTHVKSPKQTQYVPQKVTTATITIPAVTSKVPILKKPTVTSITNVAKVPPTLKCVQQPASARQDLEMKLIKRQQRMIKNRESACLSRKKKKEYLMSLENQINALHKENVQLKLENIALKERLTLYEENVMWKRPGMLTGSVKKTTAVMAILLMVSFNLGSLGGLFQQGPGSLGSYQGSLTSQQLPSTRHGRTLLWSDVENKELPSIEDPYNDMDPISNTSSNHPTCPMYINQTESIRLDSELRRWIGVDFESENSTKQPELEAKSLSELLLPPPTAKPPKPKKKLRLTRKQPPITSEVEVYGLRPHQYNYAAFFEAIHRRDDTFYVVSFSGDHLLVPALAHNKTVRPKMSLVLPALPFNESMTVPPNHITMMQIDCEVTNTQLLHVKKGDIPEQLRQPSQYSNSTTSSKSNTKDDRPHTYRPYFVKPNRKKFGEFPSESKLDVDSDSITSQTRTNMLYSKETENVASYS